MRSGVSGDDSLGSSHGWADARIDVVILTFESGAVVDRCLDALRAAGPPRGTVWVVDNASTDDTVARVRAHEGVRLIQTGANLGWAGGNNRGMARAFEDGAEATVLLNPDIVVTPGWLDRARTALAREAGIGLMDFELTEDVVASATSPGAGSGDASGVRDIDGAVGAALVVPRATVERIGYLDEDYFLYCEDVDWSWRARRAGLRTVRVGHPLWHESESSSAGDFGLLRSWLSFRNSIRLYLKHRPRSVPGWIKSLFIYACSSHPPDESIMMRFRPFGPVRNAGMVVAAVLWNVVHLPWTLATRRRELRTIERTGGERS